MKSEIAVPARTDCPSVTASRIPNQRHPRLKVRKARQTATWLAITTGRRNTNWDRGAPEKEFSQRKRNAASKAIPESKTSRITMSPERIVGIRFRIHDDRIGAVSGIL